MRRAGAVVTAISSPLEVAVMSAVGADLPLLSLVERIREPVDLVLAEGFARQPAPKIEVSRAARSGSLIGRSDELLGIVSDQRFPDYPVPQLRLDDFSGVADLLEGLLPPTLRGRPAAPDAQEGALQTDTLRGSPC